LDLATVFTTTSQIYLKLSQQKALIYGYGSAMSLTTTHPI